LICTVWIKDLEIKFVFNDSNHIMIKKCNSKKELEASWETVQALCHAIGTEIRLK